MTIEHDPRQQLASMSEEAKDDLLLGILELLFLEDGEWSDDVEWGSDVLGELGNILHDAGLRPCQGEEHVE